jgi:hypothetical protein
MSVAVWRRYLSVVTWGKGTMCARDVAFVTTVVFGG